MTTTDGQYVPSEDDVKIAWADRRLVYDAEFDRFLARVRRDAWQAGHTTGFEDALLACEIASGVKPGPPPGPTPNPHEETP